ncbi:MAG: hypothetical protein ACOVT5_15895, partial [Armatimonadaceae bacterium]
ERPDQHRLAQPSALSILGHGQTAQQYNSDRASRKLFGWHDLMIDGSINQRVKTKNPGLPGFFDDNMRDTDVTIRILAGIFLKEEIQRFITTIETHSIVMWLKQFDLRHVYQLPSGFSSLSRP